MPTYSEVDLDPFLCLSFSSSFHSVPPSYLARLAFFCPILPIDPQTLRPVSVAISRAWNSCPFPSSFPFPFSFSPFIIFNITVILAKSDVFLFCIQV